MPQVADAILTECWSLLLTHYDRPRCLPQRCSSMHWCKTCFICSGREIPCASQLLEINLNYARQQVGVLP